MRLRLAWRLVGLGSKPPEHPHVRGENPEEGHTMWTKGVVAQDVGLLLEACAAIRLPDAGRTRELRRRYLALTMHGTTAIRCPVRRPRRTR